MTRKRVRISERCKQTIKNSFIHSLVTSLLTSFSGDRRSKYMEMYRKIDFKERTMEVKIKKHKNRQIINK